MTLRGGSEGVTLTNCSCAEVEPSVFFFNKKRAGNCQRKRRKETTGTTKKPCTQSIMQKYLQQRETVGEAAADEEEEEQEQEQEEQQEDTEERGGESGDDKCIVGRGKRMMWTLKTGWHVKCVHSGYILSAYPPIIHTLYHMQTFIAIFVYSSNFY